MLTIKKSFEERYKKLLGGEYEDYLKAIEEYLPTTIRVNTIKISVEEAIKRFEENGWKFERSKFWENAFLIKSKVSIGNTLEYFLGYIHGQTFSSMLPPLVLNPQPEEIILDMCAAPGSKTTQMAQMMKNKGLIIANDKYVNRLKSLRDNVQRAGATNVVITQMDGRSFQRLGYHFDKVLLDAPCTGTGTIMKNFEILKIYNPNGSKKMSSLQKQLLASAIKISNEVVYSTCSLEPEEDEAVIDWAIKKYNVKVKRISLKGINITKGVEEWEGKEFDSEVKKTIRVYPHKNPGFEGFFIARLKV